MARTYKLVYGATEINIISTGTSGITAAKGGLVSPRLVNKQRDLPAEALRYTESWKLDMRDSSHDNVAAQINTMMRVLRMAALYHLGGWQSTPVYIVSQTTGETNPRYALVYGSPDTTFPDFFDQPFEASSLVEEFGVSVTRGIWRAGAPGSLPTAITLTKNDAPANDTILWIANHQDTSDITHLFNYDASVPAFSSNWLSSFNVDLWSVSGSTPAQDDCVYAGSTTRSFHHWAVNIATAGNFSVTIVAEYGKGGGSPTFTGFATFTIHPTATISNMFKSTGWWRFNFDTPSDWDLATVNGVSAFWVRFRISAVTTWTTTPRTHASLSPFCQRTPYVEIPDTAIKGELPPFAMIRLVGPSGGGTTPDIGTTSRVIMGAKSRNLAGFVSHLNAGGGNPAGWATAAGDDTSASTDARAPYGTCMNCTFSGYSTAKVRVTITGTNKLAAMEGTYRAFLRALQSGGAAGDCRVQLRTREIDTTDGLPMYDLPVVAMKTKDIYELIELTTPEKVLHIPFGPSGSGDYMTTNIVFQILAERQTGSSTLRIADLILIPEDEWSCTLMDPLSNISVGSSALRADSVLDMDGGIVRDRTVKMVSLSGGLCVGDTWYREGRALKMERLTQTRIYFVVGRYPSSWGTGPIQSQLGMALGVSIYSQPVYEVIRGGD